MISQQCLRQFMHFVASNPQLSGMGIGYSAGGQSRVLKQPNQDIPQGLRNWIVILEDDLPLPGGVQSQFSPRMELQNLEPTKWNSFVKEAPSAVVSCGSAVITGVASGLGVAAAPVTGGTSLAVTVIVWAGAAASAAQCGIAIGRIANNVFWNDGRNEEFLDSEIWYKRATNALDGIALLGDLVGVGESVKLIIRVSRSTGRSIGTLLRAYSRAERRRLARDLGKMMVDNNSKLFKQLVRAGKLPTIFASKQIERAVFVQLLGAFAAALDVYGSAADGLVKHIYIMCE